MMTHSRALSSSLFFFNDTATTEIYTLSLHDALPISSGGDRDGAAFRIGATHRGDRRRLARAAVAPDRKSTRLKSRHPVISYALLFFKKKNSYRPPCAARRLRRESTRPERSPSASPGP